MGFLLVGMWISLDTTEINHGGEVSYKSKIKLPHNLSISPFSNIAFV